MQHVGLDTSSITHSAAVALPDSAVMDPTETSLAFIHCCVQIMPFITRCEEETKSAFAVESAYLEITFDIGSKSDRIIHIPPIDGVPFEIPWRCLVCEK